MCKTSHFRHFNRFLFRFVAKIANKIIKGLQDIIQFWIALLHNKCNIIINIIIVQDRNFNKESAFILVFIKPFSKQPRSHGLTIVACLTLIQEDIGISQKELFNNSLHSAFYLRVIRRNFLILIEYTKFICSLFPNIIIWREYYAV